MWAYKDFRIEDEDDVAGKLKTRVLIIIINPSLHRVDKYATNRAV